MRDPASFFSFCWGDVGAENNLSQEHRGAGRAPVFEPATIRDRPRPEGKTKLIRPATSQGNRNAPWNLRSPLWEVSP